MDVFAQLKEFRQAAYECLCRAKDATFELMDAILLTRKAYSLADLSMCPVFRRKWPSIYEAIEDTRPQRHKLMRLYSKNIPKQELIVLAGDHTTWVLRQMLPLSKKEPTSIILLEGKEAVRSLLDTVTVL